MLSNQGNYIKSGMLFIIWESAKRKKKKKQA